MRRLVLLFTLVAAAGCSGGTKHETKPAADLGDHLAHSFELSTSTYNRFACSTCHYFTATAPAGRIYPGGSLHDSASRPDWFDGYSKQYLDSVNFCLLYFMRGEQLVPGDADGDALYEYLASISPDTTAPAVHYTFVLNLTALNVATGDKVHGKTLYDEACRVCHGSPGSGSGRISAATTALSAQLASDYDTLFPGVDHNVVVTEKVRHGQFYGIGGNMPFFSEEALSDSDLTDLLAYLQDGWNL